jgi:peptide deformylase
MATRNILTGEDSGLSKKSREVTDYNKRLHILLDDMRETLTEANGLGLAAPQVGVLRRVALIVDTSIETEVTEEQIIELINPKIIDSEGEQTGNEGCLSVPGVHGIVTRPEIMKIKAYDRNGKPFEFKGSGLTARAICHEIDHLNGVLFTSIAERFLTEEEIEQLNAVDEEEELSGEADKPVGD